MTTVSLDWDESERLSAESIYAAQQVPFQPIQAVSPGLAKGASSIDKAEAEARAPKHRPQLALPKLHYMLDMLDVHTQVEGIVSKELLVFKAQSKMDLAEIDRLEKEKEKEEALRRNAEDVASRNHWSILGSVAQYLAAGTSIAVGVSLGPTAWGALMIASGVVGLGNRVVRDTVGWQSIAAWFTDSVEKQKNLVRQIEMGFLYVELGTGLSGGMGAAYSGAFSALASDMGRLTAAKKMSMTIQATSSAAQATSRLGRTFVDKRISDLQVKMRILDVQAEKIRMEMTSQAADARTLIDMAQSVGQELHKAIVGSETHDL